MSIIKERHFTDEFMLSDERAAESFEMYKKYMLDKTPFEYNGFYFLIVSINFEYEKIKVVGYRLIAPQNEKM